METHEDKHKPVNSQLISVPHKDTVRLLEVYIRRSLSLNDGTDACKKSQNKEKWVTLPKRHRRHSSDPSLHLGDPLDHTQIRELPDIETAEGQFQPILEEAEKSGRKPKKSKKPSFWKNFFEIFSRKSVEDRDEEQTGPAEASPPSDEATTCLPTTPAPSRKKASRKKSLKKRLSKRRISFRKPNKDLYPGNITGVEAVVSVEPTDSYYENVSAELEKIVHEAKVKEEDKPLSNEELISRILALTKEQGDAIDAKLKDHPTLNSFFQGITYQSFQKLADAYLQEEVTPTLSPISVQPTAPELVKLAFTLDFTARIASLSKQNVGHITGLGNRYLQDRFQYKQACTGHPWSDNED